MAKGITFILGNCIYLFRDIHYGIVSSAGGKVLGGTKHCPIPFWEINFLLYSKFEVAKLFQQNGFLWKYCLFEISKAMGSCHC